MTRPLTTDALRSIALAGTEAPCGLAGATRTRSKRSGACLHDVTRLSRSQWLAILHGQTSFAIGAVTCAESSNTDYRPWIPALV